MIRGNSHSRTENFAFELATKIEISESDRQATIATPLLSKL